MCWCSLIPTVCFSLTPADLDYSKSQSFNNAQSTRPVRQIADAKPTRSSEPERLIPGGKAVPCSGWVGCDYFRSDFSVFPSQRESLLRTFSDSAGKKHDHSFSHRLLLVVRHNYRAFQCPRGRSNLREYHLCTRNRGLQAAIW